MTKEVYLKQTAVLVERDAIILDTITREEVLALHQLRLDPSSRSRSKLSVHLKPQRTQVARFSVAASEAFLSLLNTHGVSIDEQLYAQLSAAEPPVAAVKEHWTNVLVKNAGMPGGIIVEPAIASSLISAVDKLARDYPIADSTVDEVQLDKSTVFIDDVSQFRSSLRVSDPPKPVEVFHDLPVSKF